MISELLATPDGWLLLFGLLVGLVWVAAAISELDIRIPRPHMPRAPRWFPRPFRYWLPILVSYVLIAWVAIRVDVCGRRKPPADIRRDRS